MATGNGGGTAAKERTSPVPFTLPNAGRGRPNAARRAEYDAELRRFADLLQEIEARLDFKVGSRGWCYLLEEHGLQKDQFDRAEACITLCRKRGFLPIDFTAEDEARAADNLEEPDEEGP